MFSHERTDLGVEIVNSIYCEHIRLWAVVGKNKQKHTIEEIQKSYARGRESNICKHLLPCVNQQQGKNAQPKVGGQYQYAQTYSVCSTESQLKRIKENRIKQKILIVG
jgi:hypothetical protein